MKERYYQLIIYVIMMFVVTGTVSAYIHPTPINYWNMDNETIIGSTVVDIAKRGQNVNGTLDYDATYTTDGHINGGVFMDGDDDRIVLSPLSWSSEASLNVWVNISDDSGSNVIFTKGGSSTPGVNVHFSAWYTPNSNGSIEIEIGTGSGKTKNTFTNMNLSDNEYHMVTITYSDSDDEVVLYIDGAIHSSDTNTRSMNTGAANSWIGSWASTTLFYNYNKTIDELSLWDVVLGEDNITSLYNGGLGFNPLTQKTGICTPEMDDFIDDECQVIGTLTLSGDATINGTIIIQENATLDGNGSTIYRTDQLGRFILINGSNTTIENLRYEGNGTSGGDIEIPAGRENITIRENRFKSSVDQLFVANSDVDNLFIEGNHFNGSYLVLFVSGEGYNSSDMIIKDNRIRGDVTSGSFLIQITGVDGLLYENNTAIHNTTQSYEHFVLSNTKNAFITGNDHSSSANQGIGFQNGLPNINITFKDSVFEGSIEDGVGTTGNTNHVIFFDNVTINGSMALDVGEYTFKNTDFGTGKQITINDGTFFNASYDDVRQVDFSFFSVTEDFVINDQDSTTIFRPTSYFTGTTLEDSLEIGTGYVSVLDGTLMDFPATITFYGTEATDRPFRNGVLCNATYCTVQSVGTTLTFNVSGFSNYTYGRGVDTPPQITGFSPLQLNITSSADLVLNFTANYTDNESDDLSTKWTVNGVTVKNTTNTTTTNDSLIDYSFMGEGSYDVAFSVYEMLNTSRNDTITWTVTITYPDEPGNGTSSTISINEEQFEAFFIKIVLVLFGMILLVYSFVKLNDNKGKAGYIPSVMSLLSLFLCALSGIIPTAVLGIIALCVLVQSWIYFASMAQKA
jgi:hypothetical protein